MKTKHWIILAVALALLLTGFILWEWMLSQLRF